MCVIVYKEIVALINHKIVYVIYNKLFCYYSAVRQNAQWLIEEKVGCWVADRAVVYVAGRDQFESCHVK